MCVREASKIWERSLFCSELYKMLNPQTQVVLVWLGCLPALGTRWTWVWGPIKGWDVM